MTKPRPRPSPARGIIGCLVRLMLAIAITGSALAAGRPNILFIYSDDHAQSAVSAYGSWLAEAAPTPQIDRLARQGALFHHSFVANSICGPARANILTGLHSARNGFVDNNNCRFDGWQRTFPKMLQAAGYQTAIIGKWHLVSDPQGFDHWDILPGQGAYYQPEFITATGRRGHQGYVTDLVTDKAIDWLKSGRDPKRPFMLMVQHKAPHREWAPAVRHLDLFKGMDLPEPPTLFDDYSNRAPELTEQKMSIRHDMRMGDDLKVDVPLTGRPEFEGKENRHRFGAMTDSERAAWSKAYGEENRQLAERLRSGNMDEKELTRWMYQRYVKDYLRTIRAVDESIGRLLDCLDENNLAGNTVVIYSADQGFYLGEHGWYDKRWMFEPSLRTPLVVRWPGKVPAGSQPAAMVQNIDMAPTLLEMAGVPVPGDMDGRSLVPILRTPNTEPPGWRDEIYYFYSGEDTHAVAAHDGIRTKRHKLMHYPKSGRWNLFDLEKDPLEMRSVHDDPAYAEVLAEMKGRYEAHRRKLELSPATIPDHRMGTPWWRKRFDSQRTACKAGKAEIVFIGDSITQGWEEAGAEAWKKLVGGTPALNLGFSGDCTEHVLWRLFNGGWEALKPRTVVLMIGTNNAGKPDRGPGDTALGIRRIVGFLRDRSPETRVVLHAILPRGSGPDDPMRKANDEVNRLIAPLADGKSVVWFDPSKEFLAPDGSLPSGITPDALHLSAKGYGIWAAALAPVIAGR